MVIMSELLNRLRQCASTVGRTQAADELHLSREQVCRLWEKEISDLQSRISMLEDKLYAIRKELIAMRGNDDKADVDRVREHLIKWIQQSENSSDSESFQDSVERRSADAH